jgi:hypothetical protein
MKLLIQLTFNNGLGNLYCGLVEILNFVNHYKELGYECHLIFASNGNMGNNKFIGEISFEEIFDTESLDMFDTIKSVKHSVGSMEYEGFTYHSTQYGPNKPGAHWWDVFFDKLPEDEIFPKYAFNMETLLNNISIPKFLPKFNKEVYRRAELFLKNNIKNSIQIRHFDYNLQPSDIIKKLTTDLYDVLSESNIPYHLTSNNQYIIDTLSPLSNVVTYEYKNLDILPNDHGYYFYHTHIDREILLDRLYDNLTEMVLLSYYDNLYYYTSYDWLSTFLYYSKSNNQKQTLINIKNNINLLV